MMHKPLIPIAGLMGATVLALAVASAVHTGVLGLADPFPGAVIPEAVIAVVLAAGTVSLLISRPLSRTIAMATVLFALAGVLLGITFTARSGRAGDLTLHVALLLSLLVTLGLLFTPAARSQLPSSR